MPNTKHVSNVDNVDNVLSIQCAQAGGLGNTHYHQGGAITNCGPFTPLFSRLE